MMIEGKVSVEPQTKGRDMFKSLIGATVCASVLVLSGCATAPQRHNIQSSETYNVSYDAAWEGVVSYFASHNIQIKNIAKDSGVIYAEAATFDDSVADCGKPGLLVVTGRRATFNVFVHKVPAGTQVSVNTEFMEGLAFGQSRSTRQCTSRGSLEAAILNAVRNGSST
jgi:hypothetical protein